MSRGQDTTGRSTDWAEVGTGCWVRRYPEWDVNVTVIAGSDGLLVVDTRGTRQQGERLIDDIARLDTRPVRWVVQTHAHFDHTFGTVAFDPAVPVVAHEHAAAGLTAAAERVQRRYAEELADPSVPDAERALAREVVDTPLRAPDQTFSSVRTIDLGDRYVELLYPGRGHTDGDLLVRVPDAGVVLAGDLVEESAPPSYGPDCFPMDWPQALEVTLDITPPGTVVVPGHGVPVDRDFVEGQRAQVGDVAQSIYGLVSSGVPLADALADPGQAPWPWDPELLHDALRRGYEQLGPQRRTLPLA